MAESFSLGLQDHKVFTVKNQAVLQVSGRRHAGAMLRALCFIPPSLLWCYHLLYLFRVLHQEGPFTALVAPQTPRPPCRKQIPEHSHLPALSQSHHPSLPRPTGGGLAWGSGWSSAWLVRQGRGGVCLSQAVISIWNMDFLHVSLHTIHVTAPVSPSPLQWEREEGRQPPTAAPLLCTLPALAER